MSVLDGPGEGTWSVFAMKVVEERDRYAEALRLILEKDKKSMYERCPDCNHDEWCKQHKTCKSCPMPPKAECAKLLGRIGKLRDALRAVVRSANTPGSSYILLAECAGAANDALEEDEKGREER